MDEMKRRKLDQKRSDTRSDVNIETKAAPEVKQTVKRKLDTNSDEITSKVSKNTFDFKAPEVKSESMAVLMETNEDFVNKSMATSDVQQSGLPNDFFDDNKQMSAKSEETSESIDEEMETNDESKGLPKGFFDDPVMDAKARKVVFKDPMDEQWEQFQKVIAEENNVSENIIEEDIEGLQMDRNLEEIEEQIANWMKVNEMQKKAELIHSHIVNTRDTAMKEEDSDSDVDEHDLNVFSNWRSRTPLNSNK
jgi:zinc finger protein 830